MCNDSADEQTNDRAVQSFKGQVEKEALGRNKNRKETFEKNDNN